MSQVTSCHPKPENLPGPANQWLMPRVCEGYIEYLSQETNEVARKRDPDLPRQFVFEKEKVLGKGWQGVTLLMRIVDSALLPEGCICRDWVDGKVVLKMSVMALRLGPEERKKRLDDLASEIINEAILMTLASRVPNVVHLHFLLQPVTLDRKTQRLPMLVEEYVPGVYPSQYLRDLLIRGKPPHNYFWELSRQLLHTLCQLNGLGILYSDLKDNNILVSFQEGDDPDMRVVLLDLGMSCLFAPELYPGLKDLPTHFSDWNIQRVDNLAENDPSGSMGGSFPFSASDLVCNLDQCHSRRYPQLSPERHLGCQENIADRKDWLRHLALDSFAVGNLIYRLLTGRSDYYLNDDYLPDPSYESKAKYHPETPLSVRVITRDDLIPELRETLPDPELNQLNYFVKHLLEYDYRKRWNVKMALDWLEVNHPMIS